MATRTDHRDDPRTLLRDEFSKLDEPGRGQDEDDHRTPSAVESSDVTQRTADHIRGVIDALYPEISTSNYRDENGKRKTLATKTLKNYTQRLRMAATEIDVDLIDLETSDVLAFIEDLDRGRTTIGPTEGYASGTIGQYQSALKAFYRYHDTDVDPDEIPVKAPEKTEVDERDMFSVDEVKAMRAAIDSRRNRALFELLAYTGQRIRVIQSFRVKDIEIQSGATGAYYVNSEVEGRKGRSGKGPLLGAKEYVRRWLEVHPTGEPEDYLLTAIPSNGGGGEPGEMLTQDTIRYHLEQIADRAGVSKKVNPHIFRHYFTTIAKRDYRLDDAYIKRLRGDAPGSNVMETTYQHLSDGDAIDELEAKFEGREVETPNIHSPDICPTCRKELESGAMACPRCGAVFRPDAAAAQQSMQEQAEGQIPQAETESEARAVAAVLRELRENPADALEE